jgi:hypothetical protein
MTKKFEERKVVIFSESEKEKDDELGQNTVCEESMYS